MLLRFGQRTASDVAKNLRDGEVSKEGSPGQYDAEPEIFYLRKEGNVYQYERKKGVGMP